MRIEITCKYKELFAGGKSKEQIKSSMGICRRRGNILEPRSVGGWWWMVVWVSWLWLMLGDGGIGGLWLVSGGYDNVLVVVVGGW
jgi:hypothetical protein